MAFTPPSPSAAPDLYASMSPSQQMPWPVYYQDFDDLPLIKPVPQLPATDTSTGLTSSDPKLASRIIVEDKFAKLKISESQTYKAGARENVSPGDGGTSRISIPNLVTAPSHLPVAPEPLVHLRDRDFISHLPSTKTPMQDLQVLWPARVEVSSAGLREILQKNEALEKELSELRPQLKQLSDALTSVTSHYNCLSDDYINLQGSFDVSKDGNKELQENLNKLQDEHRRVLKHSQAKTDVLAEVMAELQELKKVKQTSVDNASNNKGVGGWDAGDVPLTDTWEAESGANGDDFGARAGSKADGVGRGVQAGGNANGDNCGASIGSRANGNGWGVQASSKANGDDWGVQAGGNADGDDWGVEGNAKGDEWDNRRDFRRGTDRQVTAVGWSNGQGGQGWCGNNNNNNGDDWNLGGNTTHGGWD